MDRYIGRLLDNRYEILEIIGVGGMAVVYKARDHRLKRLVAVKMLKEEFANDEEFRRRFNAESQAVAMLSHPNIVGVYDVSECDGINFIVMELIDGITLKQYMERRGTLNWREVLHFTLQIAKALEHAHSRGIIHRDIKPHNVMVLKDGSVKVADFGIARVVSAQNTLTREALGSVHYISPEQAKGGHTDCRSDIYSLGVVMYEMMTSKPPFDGESPVAVAIQHINGKAVPPRELNPEVPEGLEQICLHAMNSDIEARYSNASLMLQDLEEFRKNPQLLFSFAAEAGGTVPRSKTSQTEKTEETHGKRARRPASEPEKEEELEEKKRKRAIIWIYILCTVAIAGLAYLLFGILIPIIKSADNTVSVPSFVGMDSETINPAEYSDFILEASEVRFDDTVPFGYVISQSPEAEVKVEKGTTVSLVISRGPKTDRMPKVSGLTVNAAEELLDDLDLGLTVILDYINSSDFDKGVIINSDPVSDIVLEKGQRVTLYVSLGPLSTESVLKTVPSVTNMSLEQAEQALAAAGLQVGKVTTEESETAENTVLRQAIEAGQQIAEGTGVNLVVSAGKAKITVPYLIDKNLETAKLAISNAGLTLNDVTFVNDSAAEDTVIWQSLSAGAQAEEDALIDLRVSLGPAKPESYQADVAIRLPTPAAPEEETCSVTLYLDGELYSDDDDISLELGTLDIKMTVTSGQVLTVFINGQLDSSQTRTFD